MNGTTLGCRSHSPWDLPALTTLHLHHVELYNCSFILAMCQNLKNLTLERCEVCEPADSGRFTIINSRLLSLTLKKVIWYVGFVLVDTPQLKNFIFVDTPLGEEWTYNRKTNALWELTISAPGLTYLRIKGSYFPNLSLDGFPSSEKIVELLSTSEEVISHQPSPFTSLKSLKIYPLKGLKACTSEDLERYPLKSSLDISSNATFMMVSHEEARAIKITTVAYRAMVVLWEILENIEAYTDTKRANVEWKKTLIALMKISI
ncbi:F-box domain containing protein [Tanacetum coccineum]